MFRVSFRLLLSITVALVISSASVVLGQTGGGLGDEEEEILARLLEAQNNMAELDSYVVTIIEQEIEDHDLDSGGTTDGETNEEIVVQVINDGDFPNLSAIITYAASDTKTSEIESIYDIDQVITAEVYAVNGVVYINAMREITEEEDYDASILEFFPDGWTAFETKDELYDDEKWANLQLLSLYNYFSTPTWRFIDDESLWFNTDEPDSKTKQIEFTVVSEITALEDGSPAENIVLTMDRYRSAPLLMGCSLNTNVERTIVITLNQDNLITTIEDRELYQMESRCSTGSDFFTWDNVTNITVNEFNAPLEPIEAPEIE